jgi:hypothetical protein
MFIRVFQAETSSSLGNRRFYMLLPPILICLQEVDGIALCNVHFVSRLWDVPAVQREILRDVPPVSCLGDVPGVQREDFEGCPTRLTLVGCPEVSQQMRCSDTPFAITPNRFILST